MSFRQSIRPFARLAQRQQNRVVAVSRRAASTSSGTQVHAPKTSDTPWIIGSAVGFGSLAAFLLLPSNSTAHAAVHDTTHAKVRAEINESAPTVKEGEPLQASESLSRDVKSEDPSETHKNSDRPPSSIPAKKDQLKTMDDRNLNNDDLSPEKKSGGQNASDVAKSQAAGEANKESEQEAEPKEKPESTEEAEPEQAKGKEDGEPTQKEIKESVLQAERTNVPKAAMSEEAKGNENQAKVEDEK